MTLINSLYKFIQILFIFCFAWLSPALAFFLFFYTFILLQTVNSHLHHRYLLIVGFIFIIATLGQFNYQQLVNLYQLNLDQLKYPARWWIIIQNSFIHFKENSLNSGLLGLSGIYLIFLGLSGRIINNRVTNGIKNNTQVIISPPVESIATDAMILGEDSNHNPYSISHKELNQHTLVIGTTGSGKTVTLLNIVYNCCSQNLPLIYLDGKGSIKLVDKISQICDKFGRKLKVFSIDPGQDIAHLARYNPLAYGNFTEWKNKIATLLGEAQNKGQEHYAAQEQSYINLVCEILNKSNKPIDFEAFLAYLSSPGELQKLANMQSPEIALRLVKAGDTVKNNDIIKTLELFYYSHYGKLFSTCDEPANKVINLQQSILDREIVLFLFDAASFKRDTSLLGKLVINDINSAFSGLGRNGNAQKAFCIFDEFAAYASPNMSNILAMQRENGMHAIIGTQSIHAISQESQQVKRIAVELIANCNTFIIHKINDAHDINLLQETMGQHTQYRLHSISNTVDNRVTATLNDEYILDGNKIRALRSGFAYVCQTVANLKPALVKFNYICP